MIDSHLAAASLLFLLVAILVFIGWNIFSRYFHPLSSIPNASFLAPTSRLLWALPSEYKGRITLDLPELHEKYGPLIRIGPNELSFHSIEIYKIVHSIRSPFVKDPRVYGQFVQDAHPALFSITDPYEHSQRRRLMGQLFNLSKMGALEGLMVENVTAFIQALHQKLPKQVEVITACRALEADIVSSFGFGQEIGAIASWASGCQLNMVKANDERSKLISLHSSLPFLTTLSASLMNKVHFFTGWETWSNSAIKEFDEWSSTQLTHLTSLKSSLSSHPNFISTMIRSNLPPTLTLSEAKEMLGPGTDTTSATLAHIIWALAHDIKYQNELVRDLERVGWPTEMGALKDIARLRAAVKEGIRWAGAAAAMLPRVVPDGGAMLAGTFVAGGTVISSSPIWYGHDKIAYPSPKLYRPSRWLDDFAKTPSEVKLRDEFYVPFSKGSASCIGAHFATYELLLSLSKILKKFQLSIPHDGISHLAPAREAVLPERLEWIAAVPTVELNVCFVARKTGKDLD